jgi:hypothetical protein
VAQKAGQSVDLKETYPPKKRKSPNARLRRGQFPLYNLMKEFAVDVNIACPALLCVSRLLTIQRCGGMSGGERTVNGLESPGYWKRFLLYFYNK